MKKKIEIQEEFSEMIPNPAGIPCQENNSEQVRKALNSWKREAKLRPNESIVKQQYYWQKVSACAAL